MWPRPSHCNQKELPRVLSCLLVAMAEIEVNPSVERVGSSESTGRVARVAPEDYDIDKGDYTSIKVICLGDSAVGKSK